MSTHSLKYSIERSVVRAPKHPPREHAQQYDWDAVAKQAETAYRRAVNGEW